MLEELWINGADADSARPGSVGGARRPDRSSLSSHIGMHRGDRREYNSTPREGGGGGGRQPTPRPWPGTHSEDATFPLDTKQPPRRPGAVRDETKKERASKLCLSRNKAAGGSLGCCAVGLCGRGVRPASPRSAGQALGRAGWSSRAGCISSSPSQNPLQCSRSLSTDWTRPTQVIQDSCLYVCQPIGAHPCVSLLSRVTATHWFPKPEIDFIHISKMYVQEDSASPRQTTLCWLRHRQHQRSQTPTKRLLPGHPPWTLPHGTHASAKVRVSPNAP